MILLDRNARLSLLMAMTISLFSCEDPSEVGLSLNASGNQIGVFFEELSLPVTNVFIDSLRTSDDRRFLVGSYNDPVFGKTTSAAITQISPFSFSFIEKEDSLTEAGEEVYVYQIDSVILQLRYNYFHSDNFGQDQTLTVRQINDTLFSGVSYFAEFPIPSDDNDAVFGQKTFTVNPEVDTVFKMELPGLDEDFLRSLDAPNIGTNNSDFIFNDFKGIAVVPDENNSAILGFDPVSSESLISIYYRIVQVQNVMQDSTILDSLFVNFPFTNVVRYNSIEIDRTNSLMNATNENLAEFDINNGNVYLQSSSGIYPKIDLGPFHQFLDENPNLILNRTDIVVSNAAGQVTQEYIQPVEGFNFYFAEDSTNFVNNPVSILLTNGSYLTGSFSSAAAAFPNETDNNYEVETTLFTQLVNSGTLDVNNLILVTSDLTSMNQNIFDKSGVKMKIFYTIPD